MTPSGTAHLATFLALACGLAGCSGGEADAPPPAAAGPASGPWIRLAAGEVEVERVRPLEFELEGRAVEVVDEDGADWLRTLVRRAEWSPRDAEEGTLWVAPLAVRGAGRPADGSPPQRLVADGRAFEFQGPTSPMVRARLAPGGFHAGDELTLLLPDGEEPPPEATLAVYARRREYEGDRLRIAGERISGDGFALWPGESLERVVDLPPASTLRFALCVEPAFDAAEERRGRPVRMRVFLDGEPLVQRAFNSDEHAIRNVAIPLPPAGRPGARLRFEVRGAPAYASFLAPVVGPAEVDDRASRPDVVVFLADTFRADNLAAYRAKGEHASGADRPLTPRLDALAEESLLFRRAWSASTYTLPSHLTLFLGVHPRQAGARGWRSALPDVWTTLAEHLAGHGWRTGAVTESVFVSSDYGMDQGFEWWDEHLELFDGTLDRVRAFLDADDGRPTFLFVQTYRTHTPYTVSEGTRARLGLEDEWIAVESERLTLDASEEGRADPVDARLARTHAALERLYRAAAADLDAGFAALCDDLGRRGHFERGGHLVFTSDHGEAFGEHGTVYHGGRVYEEKVRVPLFVHGPRARPGVEERAASLIDLAPTVADLAGVPALEEWSGRSLVALDADRPVFLFECRRDASTLAVVEGTHKAIALETSLDAAEPLEAYDLARDPREREDVARVAAWAAELITRWRETLADALVPAVEPVDAALDDARLQELKAMGYTGD